MNRPLRIFFLFLFLCSIAAFGVSHRSRAANTLAAGVPAEPVEVCNLSATPFITWGPVEVECPVCKTRNRFLQWMSFGSYIYQDPSKYQLVFFPFTASPEWWSCKKCRYTTSAGDFKTVDAEKLPALRRALAEISLPAQKDGQKDPYDCPYLQIPASERVVAAEKVVRALGRNDGDEEFWHFFYRLQGYYFGEEKKTPQADEARRKALAITERLLKDEANQGRRKELLYISGAMRHFLRDDVGARKDFEEARKLLFSQKDLEAEKNKNYDGYLSSVIGEYLEMLDKGKGPRDLTTASGGHRH